MGDTVVKGEMMGGALAARRCADMLHFEMALWGSGHTLVAGVDEVGVGPLAGPVVAAAVIMPAGVCWPEVNDSKVLSPRVRVRLAAMVRAQATAWACGTCTAAQVDSSGIFAASREASRRALAALPVQPTHVLIDAFCVPGLHLPQTHIVRGDARSQSIAAASIVAKVARDAMMCQHDAEFAGYDFAQHKGYGTPGHLRALFELGACALHRHSFAPVRRAREAFARPIAPA